MSSPAKDKPIGSYAFEAINRPQPGHLSEQQYRQRLQKQQDIVQTLTSAMAQLSGLKLTQDVSSREFEKHVLSKTDTHDKDIALLRWEVRKLDQKLDAVLAKVQAVLHHSDSPENTPREEKKT